MDYGKVKLEPVYNEAGNRWDVEVSGEVDIFNSADFKKSLTDLLTEHSGHLYLRCKNLEYIDSTALGALVGVMKTVKTAGNEIHLVDVKSNLMKLFKITNLDTVFVMDEGGEQSV
jgi:anti-sigma B factor antagonist